MPGTGPQRTAPADAETPADPELRTLRRRQADLIRRIYEVDPLAGPRCGGTMSIIAFITEPRVIGPILKHLTATRVDASSPPQADRSSIPRPLTAA